MKTVFEKYIRNYKEVKEIGSAYDFAFNFFENKAKLLTTNQYIKQADEATIKEWEVYLEIPTDDTLSLDDRRGQILLKLFTKPPYTLNNIIAQINAITGIECEVDFDYTTLKLTVNSVNIPESKQRIVKQYLDWVKPCNVIYELIKLIDAECKEYVGMITTYAPIYNVEMSIPD